MAGYPFYRLQPASPINREHESIVDKRDVDWHGPMPSVITPYDAEGGIDEDAFLENIEHCIGYGMTGLMVAGNSGDFWSLSVDERKRLMALGIEGARGRVPGIACTGAFLAPDVIELARTAAQIGCAGVMVLPPSSTAPTQRTFTAITRPCRTQSSCR